MPTLADGIRRDRDAGGRMAIVTNIAVDLDQPTTLLGDAVAFHLRRGAAAAAERLGRLPDLGFDDAILVPTAHDESRLAALRKLVP